MVSVIIRTLNEAKWIEPLMQSLRAQTLKDFEIILVDSSSFDGTVEIGRKYCDQILEINQEEFTFGFALNYGIKHAKGDLIGILSAHTLPLHTHWLESLAKVFQINPVNPSKIAMAYGKQLGNSSSHFSELLDFERHFKDNYKVQFKPNYFCNNANSMIRRDLWSLHPFDEALSGLEDIEWAKYWMDKGHQIVYEPKAAIYHIHQESPEQIKRRHWRETKAAKTVRIATPISIFFSIPREIFLFFTDIIKLIKRKKKFSIRKIFVYRTSKLKGILKALFSKKEELLDFSSNYSPFEYKVVKITGQNKAHLTQNVLEPTKPNEVLIKLTYVGICETDMEVLAGNLGYYKSGWAKYPIVPGHEYSGTVVRKGGKVKNIKIGDKVVGRCILSCGVCNNCLSGYETACKERKEVGVLNYDGAYSEYINLAFRFIHKIPREVSLKKACNVEPLAVVLKGLSRLGIESSADVSKECILITGAGPIGHLAARVCYHYGHDVTIVEKNPYRRSYLNDLKIDVIERMPELGQYTSIIEATGVRDLAKEIINRSKVGVKILLLGLPYGETPVDLESTVCQDKIIVGSVGSGAYEFQQALNLIHHLDLTHMDNCVYDFNNWKDSWEEHKKKKFLKVKLRICNENED